MKIDCGYMLSFPKILVTGNHRSGTRIISKILAKELGYRYVDEREINHDDFNKITELIQPGDPNSVVIQCPGAFWQCHLHGRRKRVLIIRVLRNKKDVVKSQIKANFNWENHFKRNVFSADTNSPHYSLEGNLDLRDIYWDKYKGEIKNKLELEYESFSTHPMWIDKTKRKNFSVDQTCL